MKVSVRTGSTANPYLNNDGMLDLGKLSVLKTKLDKAAESFEPEVKKTRAGFVISPVFAKTMKDIRTIDVVGKGTKIGKNKDGSFSVIVADQAAAKEAAKALSVYKPSADRHYVHSAKAKTEKFNGTKNRKGDQFTYLGRRAVRVAERKRLTPAAICILPFYDKTVVGATLSKQVTLAERAIKAHVKNSDKYKATIQKARGQIRDEKSKSFGEAIKEVTPLLEAAGIPANKIVVGKSMAGQSLYVQLPSKKVLSISLSDVSVMRKAAKDAAMASESSVEVDIADDQPTV